MSSVFAGGVQRSFTLSLSLVTPWGTGVRNARHWRRTKHTRAPLSSSQLSTCIPRTLLSQIKLRFGSLLSPVLSVWCDVMWCDPLRSFDDLPPRSAAKWLDFRWGKCYATPGSRQRTDDIGRLRFCIPKKCVLAIWSGGWSESCDCFWICVLTIDLDAHPKWLHL